MCVYVQYLQQLFDVSRVHGFKQLREQSVSPDTRLNVPPLDVLARDELMTQLTGGGRGV